MTTPIPDRECIIKNTEKLSFGTRGRLYSKDLGINTALYFIDMAKDSQKYLQSVVDKDDSAAYMYFYTLNTKVISDHNFQGFNALKNSSPGKAKIYRICEDKNTVEEYICVDAYKGTNTGQALIKEDGTDAVFPDPDGLILYTCMENSDNNEVFIAHYELTNLFTQ